MNQGILEGFEEYTHPYGISGLQEQATPPIASSKIFIIHLSVPLRLPMPA